MNENETKPVPPLVASLIRTVVPYIVGLLLALLAKANLNLPEEMATEVVMLVAGAVYYGVVRILETRGKAAWGWLLGLPKLPTYEATAKKDPESPTGESATPDSEVAAEDEPVETVAAGAIGDPDPLPQSSLLRSPRVEPDEPPLDEPVGDEPPSEEFGSKPPA